MPDITDNVGMDNIRGVAVGLDAKHASGNPAAGLGIALA